MQETMRTDIFNDFKNYNWNVTTDEIYKPSTATTQFSLNNNHQNLYIKYLDYIDSKKSIIARCDNVEQLNKYMTNLNEDEKIIFDQLHNKKMNDNEKQMYKMLMNKIVPTKTKLKYLIQMQELKDTIEINSDKLTRQKILNYYYESLLPRPRFDFKNLTKNDRHIINNYYFDYFDIFNKLSDKIMDSKQSWFITGPGGSGKTTLIKDLQRKMDGKKLKYMSLCPTNLAALLVDGMTIHKFSARLKKSSNIKNLDLDYIFIDEVSMMQEVFYKFLMMIKKIKPEIKYIISGDYNQLKPVNDRISQYTDYGNSPCPVSYTHLRAHETG
jgi:hypothetical protein